MLAQVVLLYFLLGHGPRQYQMQPDSMAISENDSAEDSGVINIQVEVYAGKDTEDEAPKGRSSVSWWRPVITV